MKIFSKSVFYIISQKVFFILLVKKYFFILLVKKCFLLLYLINNSVLHEIVEREASFWASYTKSSAETASSSASYMISWVKSNCSG